MRRPTNLTPELLNLVKLTYNEVIKDKVITDNEMEYLTKLHYVLFDVLETDRDTILREIEDISKWKITIK